jgi:hypothetical protein
MGVGVRAPFLMHDVIAVRHVFDASPFRGTMDAVFTAFAATFAMLPALHVATPAGTRSVTPATNTISMAKNVNSRMESRQADDVAKRIKAVYWAPVGFRML